MIYGVILAGGKGERFWPLSRTRRPKQLIRFGEKTLLETAYDRVSQIADRTWIITGLLIEGEIKKLLPQAEVIAEPIGKNTGPACFYTGMLALREHPEAVLIVAPSDHVIKDVKAFLDCARLAVEVANKGYLVTFGVLPTRPETGYGYIERGDFLGEGYGARAYVAKRFHEKPDRATAEEYMRSGRFYWNSGMFVWRADVLYEQVKRNAPDIVKAMPPDMNLEAFYRDTPSISVDYAVMEKAEKIAVVEATFDWEDAGSFASLERVFPPDERGNVIWGDAIQMGAEGCVLASEGGLVAVWGVRDLVVVHTPDATLVIPRSDAQKVKEILAELGKDPKRKSLL
ncbi:MAG: sugar phosphate nucleotidyltransferase [candidate division WOR-3 bacterium]